MALPTTPKAMQRFLGAANFYRRLTQLLHNHATLVAPLYVASAQKPDSKPEAWPQDVALAFEKVKHLIAKRTLLDHPNMSLPTSLMTDASNYGIGAVLQQQRQDNWLPIAFFF